MDQDSQSGGRADRDYFDLRGATIHHPAMGGGQVEPKPRVRSNLPPLPSTIVPRQELTGRIHAALEKGERTGVLRQAAARAHGGYGKTVSALLYAHDHAETYPGGRFFLSMEGADFVTRLASLGVYFSVNLDTPPEAAALHVKLALESAASLLILDNVTDNDQWQAMLSTGLVPHGECRVLVTSRAERIGQTDPIDVGRLSNKEAREVYRSFSERGSRNAPDDDTADAITEALGGLAVAVAAVGARMRLRRDMAWEKYAERVQTLPVSDLPDVREDVRRELGIGGAALEEYRRTLQVLDDAFDGLPAPQQRAVEYAALLPADKAPRPWLEWLLDNDGEITFEFEADDDSPPSLRVLDHLEDLGVLTPRDEDDRVLSLHRLWRARVNERASEWGDDRAALWSAVEACAQSRRDIVVGEGGIDDPAVLTDATLRWELEPLAGVVGAFWEAGRVGAAARVGVWIAPIHRRLGLFVKAKAMLAPVVEREAAVEDAVGAVELATCYSNLAAILQDLGDLAGSRSRMERAIEIDEKHYDTDHPTLAIRYSNLATILQDLGDFAGARSRMERAIEIDEKHYDADHPTLAIRYSNLAVILKDLGDFAGARSRMERAIEIDKKHYDTDHPTLAIRYSNLATILRALGDLAGARSRMERAIEIDQKHYDADHPKLATRYSNLATILKDLGDLAGARSRMERAIEIDEKHYDADHPTLAISYSNLATILQDLGDLAGARSRMERAIEIDEKHYDADHPMLATRYNNLALIEHAEGDRDAACANWRRALTILRKHVDESHPHIQATLTSMARAGCTASDG